MRRILNAILFSLLCGMLLAQSMPQVMPSFQEMMSDFALIQEEHAGNQKLLDELNSDLKELTQTVSTDAILENSIRLHRKISHAIQTIEQEQERQVTFKNSLSRYSGDKQLLRQEQTYISHYLDELRKYGREQEGVLNFLLQMRNQLGLRIVNMPPPPRFLGNFGIEFVLVSVSKGNAFYITKAPLTDEQICTIWRAMHPELPEQEWQKLQESFIQKGIGLDEAREIAGCMGRLIGGFPCTLPAESQLDVLQEYGQILPKAVWLDGKQLVDPTEKEALVRFGMTIGRIWDPAARLGSLHNQRGVSSEVPWAKYPELGCVLTTTIDAGRANQRAIIEKLLDQANAAADSAKATPQEAKP